MKIFEWETYINNGRESSLRDNAKIHECFEELIDSNENVLNP
jgi:hypothetical protein